MTDQPIPTTLDEAVDILVAQMSDDDKARYYKEPKDYPGISFHFTGGMAMRNGWGLWHGRTCISKWLRTKKIYHGDDQSCVIYKALWRRLHDLPLSDKWLATEAARFEGHWRGYGLTWDQKPIPGAQPKTTRLLRVKRGGGVEGAE